jgi:putative ABC transport system permease protein
MDKDRLRGARQILWLAYRDFVHERRISLCFILALMAVLAPLLVLFGLKFGLVDTMAQRLVESPQNREVIGVGSGRYDQTWFDRMARRPDVAFLVPNTRRIAASLSSLRNLRNGRQLRAVQMIPTAAQDPLLGSQSKSPTGSDQLILSASAARELDAQVGDGFEARVDRRRNDRDESVAWRVELTGIAPSTATEEAAAFVPLALLEATEDYRDGLAVPPLGWQGATPRAGARDYARFRLFAKSIYDVAGLQQALAEEGIEVRTRSTEIEVMQALDRNLARVFWLIAIIGTLGFVASLAANLLANVERKRRELSVIRLIGFSTRSIVLFPVAQSVIIGLIGALGAGAVYIPVAVVLNIWFAQSLRAGEYICRLLPSHFLVAVVGTLCGAGMAAAWAGYRAARIEPAEGLRDV